MVLAISTVALLSLLGVWLVVQSGSLYRINRSVERRETAFNLAEGGLQLSWQCLRQTSNERLLKNLVKKQDVTPSSGEVPYMAAQQAMGVGKLTPRITFLDAETVPGWDINKFKGYYYLAHGQGVVQLPAQKGGGAQSEVVTFVQKIGQIRSR